jgi:prepilin-type N-terminal cleavage/methylation domain-containing protein
MMIAISVCTHNDKGEMQKMKSKIRSKQQGFTIIEVLIVLAIAGLIMLIVFLAIPTLQRNSRNTQRNNDASLVLAAVNECINNKNGQTTSCNSTGEIAPFGDVNSLRQLVTVTFPSGGAAPPPGGDVETLRLYYDAKCTPAGDDDTSGTQRQFIGYFRLETSGSDTPRCLDG